MVGSGLEFDDDGAGKRTLSKTQRDARAEAVASHRARLAAITSSQAKQVDVDNELVLSVRQQLCGGESRWVLLADVLAFYELMAFYCKKELDITQIVYEQLAPVATLGVSVRVETTTARSR